MSKANALMATQPISKPQQTTLNKAIEVNRDSSIYGTFAEIGAGQEVARHFFQAGQASQTVAKTISAYDMVYSDEIYGKESNGRYVCESRLDKMLDKEYKLLLRRLETLRGDRTKFFAYSNTVTTGDQNKRYCHGWMGIRFQSKFGGEPNDIVLHVRMLDKYRLQQQETLGILGANLVWSAFFATQDPKDLLPALVANIRQGQVGIDMIRCSGPDLKHFNNHILNLELVKRNLTEAVMFGPTGEILNIGDTLFGRPILIDRGEFRPVTNTHQQLIEKGISQFPKNFPKAKDPLVLFEITMQNLMDEGELDEADFLNRIETLNALGRHVLVSNFFLFYRLKRFLRQSTKEPVAILLQARHLHQIFDESHYRDLEGGLIEGMAKLLNTDTRLYVCPQTKDGQCLLAENFAPAAPLKLVFDYFRSQNWITDLGNCEDLEEVVHSDEIRALIAKGDPAWEKHVPSAAAKIIKAKGLFKKQ